MLEACFLSWGLEFDARPIKLLQASIFIHITSGDRKIGTYGPLHHGTQSAHMGLGTMGLNLTPL